MVTYYDVLAGIHELLKPDTYLEIGVRDGLSFTLAGPATRCIGIDPDSQFTCPQGDRLRLFPLTSDDFFDRHDLLREFRGLPVDLAFIDGMHLFEFALRDFINVERYCSSGSLILIHDTVPIDRVTSERNRTTGVWTGDVWKLLTCLQHYRPDLKIFNLAVPPSGLAVIAGLDPQSRVLEANLAGIYKEYVPMDYSYFEENRHQFHILNEWQLEDIIPARAYLEAGNDCM